MGKPGTDNSVWISRVRSLLREGYGVEDVAIRLDCDVEAVRSEVCILRESGVLDQWYKEAAQ